MTLFGGFCGGGGEVFSTLYDLYEYSLELEWRLFRKRMVIIREKSLC